MGTILRRALFAFAAFTSMNPRARSTSDQSKRLISAPLSPANAPMASTGNTSGACAAAASRRARSSSTVKISGGLPGSVGRPVCRIGLVSIILRRIAYPNNTLMFARKLAPLLGEPGRARSQLSSSSTVIAAIGRLRKVPGECCQSELQIRRTYANELFVPRAFANTGDTRRPF